MKVATRLALGFTIQVVLLGGVLVYHVRTIREATSIAHDLTAISSRVYRTASEQVGRVAQLEENSAKYIVTRDAGYLAKFHELAGEFSSDLAGLQLQELTSQERAELDRLVELWQQVHGAVPAGADAAAPGAVALMPEAALDSLRNGALRLSRSSYEAMLAQLERADEATHRAERLSWVAALLVLLLTVIVAAALVRFIDAGLSRLTAGTREVAAGRFGYRLEATGDDEFADVARDFNTMTARLDELDRMKRDFVSKVSHDLKTPLASMQETIQVLLDGLPGPLNARQRRLLELNLQSGSRLRDMLAKLLDLSRLEAGGVEPTLQDVEAAALIDRVAAAHGVQAVLPPADELALRGDPDRLHQLLENLVENATKFSPAGGVVLAGERVDTPVGSQVRITVADRGPGVPVADRTRVFDRFYQGEAGRALSARGVGLGLTICREIVAMHAGGIRVDDRPGGGSVFEVLLPAAGASAGPARQRPQRAPATAAWRTA